MTVDDLGCQNKEFYHVFFWRFFVATHISRVNCAKIARDLLGQPAYETFSIKRSFH